MRYIYLILFLSLILPDNSSALGTYGYADGIEIVGINRHHTIQNDEQTFYDIARQYSLGITEMVAANPGMSKWAPMKGSRVKLPLKWILPRYDKGVDIYINLAEMRLYRFYPQGGRTLVSSYPIGVGIDGYDTPLGDFRVSDRLVKPNWYVPKGLRKLNPELPRIVLPGDDNPLGEYAIKLSDSSYFIHGTNKPDGIGMRVSHGCIRLYPEDIKELFSIVRRGTSVRIAYEPIKVGVKGQVIYIEVHEDYLERVDDIHALAGTIVDERKLGAFIDPKLLNDAIKQRLGIPVMIGNLSTRIVIDEDERDDNVAKTKKTPEAEASGDSLY